MQNILLKRMTVKERQEIGQNLHRKRIKGALLCLYVQVIIFFSDYKSKIGFIKKF